MSSAFPAPRSIATPEGCEGWEEMYPHYALFEETREEADAGRLWFWNSMHFPVPMPAFDVASIDGPYYALGAWQNRAFAVPPAMGIDYRVVNSYIYISVNPVTDPAKIAERAEYFQKRAGHYFANWDELYAKWKSEDGGAAGGARRRSRCPRCPSTSPSRSSSATTTRPSTRCSTATRARCGCRERMWQHHFEFLLLGYGAYLTFSDFCKQALPDIPDQHIAQMVAGIDVLLFRPDAELRRLARLAVDTGVDGVVRGRPLARRGRRGAGSRATRAAPGSRSSRRSRTRGSTWPRATACTTTTAPGRTTRASRTRRSPGTSRAIQNGRLRGAPDRGARPRARPARRGLRGAAHRRAARPVHRAAAAVADGVPVRRGAQVLLRLLVPDLLVQQGPRVRRAARRRRLSGGRRGRLPALAPRGRCRRWRSSCCTGRPAAWRSGRRTGRRSSRAARRCWPSSRTGRRRPRSGRCPRPPTTRSP